MEVPIEVGWFRKRIRAEPPSDIGDIEVGHAVRLAWQSAPLGWVMWIRWEHGTCGVHWDNASPGKVAIEKIKFLRPAAEPPASGLDVRGK
jgi:hypothetical protein